MFISTVAPNSRRVVYPGAPLDEENAHKRRQILMRSRRQGGAHKTGEPERCRKRRTGQPIFDSGPPLAPLLGRNGGSSYGKGGYSQGIISSHKMRMRTRRRLPRGKSHSLVAALFLHHCRRGDIPIKANRVG